MNLVNATINDDRGRSVGLINPNQIGRDQSDLAAAPSLSKLFADVIKAESRRVNPERIGLTVAACAVLLVARLLFRRVFPGAPPMAGLIVFWGGIALFTVAMRILTRRTRGFTLASTAVSTGLCGSCGYSLHRLDAASDGCVVCPECGAAWRACRITRPHWAGERHTPFRAPWMLRWLGMVPSDKQLLGRDARGAYFRIIDKHLRLVPPDRRAALGAERLNAARRAVGRVGLIGRCLLALLPLAIAVGIAFGPVRALLLGSGEDAELVIVLLALTLFFVLLTAATVRSHAFSLADRRGAVLADRRLCGCCAGDLPADSPQPDGLTNCATCGAAWRAPGTSDGLNCEKCGYSLRGLSPDPGGNVTCPECGSAASVPVLRSPAPPL